MVGARTVGPVGENGTAPEQAIESQARKIAQRGDAPSAAHFGRLVHAGINDILLGGLDRRDAAGVFSGVRTVVGVARNREAVDDLCREMGDDESARREEEKAQLRARLAELNGPER